MPIIVLILMFYFFPAFTTWLVGFTLLLLVAALLAMGVFLILKQPLLWAMTVPTIIGGVLGSLIYDYVPIGAYAGLYIGSLTYLITCEET